MAMYHLHARFVKRAEGKSAVAAAAYRAGELYDFRHKTHVEHSEILLPDHVPAEMADRSTLWNRVETGLSHPRAQTAFEVEVALPRELGRAQCVQLVREFAQSQFVRQGVVVDFAIHRLEASDGLDHPHAHMLITTRRWKDDGSLDKTARDMQDNPKLLQKVYALEKDGRIDEALLVAKGTNLANWRKAWADYSNDFLQRAGAEDRIDHRTLAAQQIEREATPNIGVAYHRGIDRLTGWLADKVAMFKEINWRNNLRDQFDRIRGTRKDLTAEFIAHAREYARDLVEGLEPKKDKWLEHDR